MLLATGVTNRRPPMDEELHDEALARGLIRYCPICDGYEVTDQKVGVIGSGAQRRRRGGVPARLHRRHHPDRAATSAHDIAAEDRARLASIGIRAVDGPCHAVAALDDAIVVETPHGHHTFDSVYPALGSDVHSELAGQIGVALSEETGCILVDAHQRTNVPGAYAAGDVVLGLDQISHAMGEGGVAATTIRNDLAQGSGRCCADRSPGRGGSGQKGGSATTLPLREIGDAGPERDQRALAVRLLDLEQVAGAEILDRDDACRAASPAALSQGRPIRSA